MAASAQRIEPGTGRAPRRLLWLVLGLLLSGCAGEPSDSARVRGLVEPHVDALASYDRWARRLSQADPAFRSEEALREAAFAPLRDRSDVAAAWIERVGPDARALRHPDDAPDLPTDGWVRVTTDSLGELRGQLRRLRIGAQERELVLVRRSSDAPGDATLHVTMAFGAAPSAAE